MPSLESELLADACLLLVVLCEEKASSEGTREALPASCGVKTGGSDELRGEYAKLRFRWSADEAEAVCKETALKRSDRIKRGSEVVNAGAANERVQPSWCVSTEVPQESVERTLYFRCFGFCFACEPDDAGAFATDPLPSLPPVLFCFFDSCDV